MIDLPFLEVDEGVSNRLSVMEDPWEGVAALGARGEAEGEGRGEGVTNPAARCAGLFPPCAGEL